MIIILFAYLQFIKAQIYYDTGYYTGFDSNACDPGSSSTKKISFSSTFQTIPKVFYHIGKFSLQFTTGGTDAQVKSEILSITNTDFEVKVSCPLNSGFSSSYTFQWYATIIPSITVIKSNTITNPRGYDIYTHSHSNSLATQGFPMLVDLEYNGPFQFYITVYQVTSNQVKVQFISSTNLPPVSFGYFVVIGPANTFETSNVLGTGGGNGNLSGSTTTSIPDGGIMLIPCPGFGWSLGRPQIQIGITQTSSSATFLISTFSPSTLTTAYFYKVWMKNNIMIYPMYVRKYRTTLNEYQNIDVPIKVILNGQTYSQVGKYQQTIPTATQTAQVQIFMEFFPNTMLQGTLLKCNNCGTNFNYLIRKYYVIPINMIIFNIDIQQQQANDAKNLEITISSMGVQIVSAATVPTNKAIVVSLYFQNTI